MSKKFFYVKNKQIHTCYSPNKKCDHTHTLYLSTAARELTKNFKKEYHISNNGEIERCNEENNCVLGPHFLQRHEVVKHHKITYDFSGPWRALPNPYTSLLEKEFAEFVELLGYQTITNTRKVIGPYELDLYLPEIDVAFEFNGDYWHSDEKIRERYDMSSYDYHKLKHTLCEQQGIYLGFVWESNWKQDWVTIIDTVCEAIQFKRNNKILKSFSYPVTPMQLYFEKVDQESMEKAREKLSKRYVKNIIGVKNAK